MYLVKRHSSIFTVEEELKFAGHPILGAAAIVHREYFTREDEKKITFILKDKMVTTVSKVCSSYYEVTMNQGRAQWITSIDSNWKDEYCKSLNLSKEDLCEEYPMEVVSTGLPYLLVPIKSGIEKVKISCNDFEDQLTKNQAKFVYIFDMNKFEGRTWDNSGAVEDVATGSATGPMGAYLYKYGLCKKNEAIDIHQGRFVGRPSVLKVSCKEDTGEIMETGEVSLIMKGELTT